MERRHLLLLLIGGIVAGFFAGVAELTSGDSWVNGSGFISPNTSWSENVNITGQFFLAGNDTGNIGGGLLTAGSCTSGNTTVKGATTNSTVLVTPNSYPGDGTFWMGYVASANFVIVKECVVVSLTPPATVYHVRVIG